MVELLQIKFEEKNIENKKIVGLNLNGIDSISGIKVVGSKFVMNGNDDVIVGFTATKCHEMHKCKYLSKLDGKLCISENEYQIQFDNGLCGTFISSSNINDVDMKYDRKKNCIHIDDGDSKFDLCAHERVDLYDDITNMKKYPCPENYGICSCISDTDKHVCVYNHYFEVRDSEKETQNCVTIFGEGKYKYENVDITFDGNCIRYNSEHVKNSQICRTKTHIYP